MTAEAATAGPSADDLILRHRAMMSRSIAGDLPAAETAGFVEAVAAAGATTLPGPSRDSLRDILYFWASDQANRGERTRDASPPRLAPFAAQVPPARPASGPEPGPVVEGPAASPPGRPGLAGTPSRATAVPYAAGPDPDDHVEREARARSILRIAALARQWRTTTDPDTRRGYLLTGKALTEASLYADEDPDTRAFVEASQDAARAAGRRMRRVKSAFVTLLVLLLGATAVAIYLKEEQDKARLMIQRDQAQQLASAGIVRERVLIRSRARNIVDALERNDLAPLRTFLERTGDASPDEVARLQLGPPTAEAAADITSQKPSQRRAPPAQPRQAATCTGYLWFGTADDSRLADKRNPGTLKPGETVTLDGRSDIRLRADWPTPDTYVMGRQIGLVPAGATVTVAGETRAFRKGQVWAQVSVPQAYCTTAFLQYVGAAGRTVPVLAALDDLGMQTPPAEQVTTAKGLAEVRYFWPADQAVSNQAAAALGPIVPGQSLRVLALTDFPTKPPPGAIEVWLDLGE